MRFNYFKLLIIISMTLDNKLKNDHHINPLSSTIRKFFYVFNDIFNIQIKKQMYISHVQSILNLESNCVSSGILESHKNSLKSTINSLIKLLFNKPKYTNNEYVYRELNIYITPKFCILKIS